AFLLCTGSGGCGMATGNSEKKPRSSSSPPVMSLPGCDAGGKQARRGEGKDLAASLGDTHRVLILRGKRTVAGDSRPAVRQHLHMRLAEIDHRLDREDHAWAHLDAF